MAREQLCPSPAAFPTSQHTAQRAVIVFKPQHSICRPPRRPYGVRRSPGSAGEQLSTPQMPGDGSTAVQEPDEPSLVTGSAPLLGGGLRDMSDTGPFWVTGMLWPTWLMLDNGLSFFSAMLRMLQPSNVPLTRQNKSLLPPVSAHDNKDLIHPILLPQEF